MVVGREDLETASEIILSHVGFGLYILRNAQEELSSNTRTSTLSSCHTHKRNVFLRSPQNTKSSREFIHRP